MKYTCEHIMSPQKLRQKGYGYQAADQDESALKLIPLSNSFVSKFGELSWVRFICIFVISVVWTYLVGSWGFRAGENHVEATYQTSMKVQMVHHSFTYNEGFVTIPEAVGIRDDECWATLFPVHSPYFIRPSIHPNHNPTTFSVFYPLHCVKNGLRHGYWEILQAARNDKALLDADISSIASPRHIQHFLEYLSDANIDE
ncbi:hypothetical protein G7Y89_g5804 [Cudoniella acicularis]|uniref:Uncharacterized protein n=1 Tax=Cudoniella acicularis TaxID=354080 RepID=A0A8H4W3G8_9HELO|nr:hypothetical protein G7Y89_g5804 [Cudoniella acicularis]